MPVAELVVPIRGKPAAGIKNASKYLREDWPQLTQA